MKECDVILTQAGTHVGLQVMRSLMDFGLRVGICDFLQDGPAFKSGIASETFRAVPPEINEKRFISDIIDGVRETGAGMVMPIFNAEVIARHRSEFPEGTIIPIDSEEKLLLLDDKKTSLELARSIDIPIPRTYRSCGDVSIFPSVVKRRKGLGGDSVYFPKTQTALNNLLKNADPEDMVIMDYIEGYDISVDAIRWDSYFSAGAYRTILPRTKGMSILRQSVRSDEIVSYVRRMLDVVDFRGVCGFDFRVESSSGKAYFLECNPRFSGGIGSQIASGFDIPSILYNLAKDNTRPCTETSFKEGILTGSSARIESYIRKMEAKGKLTSYDIQASRLGPITRVDDI